MVGGTASALQTIAEVMETDAVFETRLEMAGASTSLSYLPRQLAEVNKPAVTSVWTTGALKLQSAYALV